MDSWQADYALWERKLRCHRYERLRAVHWYGLDAHELSLDLRPHECQRMDDEWYETFVEEEPAGEE